MIANQTTPWCLTSDRKLRKQEHLQSYLAFTDHGKVRGKFYLTLPIFNRLKNIEKLHEFTS